MLRVGGVDPCAIFEAFVMSEVSFLPNYFSFKGFAAILGLGFKTRDSQSLSMSLATENVC